MIEKYNTTRVRSRILEVVSDLSWINEKVDEFVNNPTAEAAQEIESVLTKFSADGEAMKNAITTLAKEVAGVEEEDGSVEIDVIPDENGLRLN
jgi:hypothetical protein